MRIISFIEMDHLGRFTIDPSEAFPCFRTGIPGKEENHFVIAPLDPALPGWACGERAGHQCLAAPFTLTHNSIFSYARPTKSDFL
jgi:hypothetical protein